MADTLTYRPAVHGMSRASIYDDENNRIVAELPATRDTSEQDRLGPILAAAPELLEALRELRDEVSGSQSSFVQAAIAKADAALAKALPEAS